CEPQQALAALEFEVIDGIDDQQRGRSLIGEALLIVLRHEAGSGGTMRRFQSRQSAIRVTGNAASGIRNMNASQDFFSIHRHGFVRTAVCLPSVRVADPAHNGERTIGLARRASVAGASLALFPELGLSAYSCEDLFHQD